MGVKIRSAIDPRHQQTSALDGLKSVRLWSYVRNVESRMG
jgi:hypothetical protein